MASFRITETSIHDDDVDSIIGEYSIPNLAEITNESLLTKSQYAKVIFHDLLACYPTDADIWCRYSLTDGITSHHGDRVALYRVGWSSVHDYVLCELAPKPSNEKEKEFQVLFRAETLPKDNTEFYQLCYVNVGDSVCGASVPFQFRPPFKEELCEVEEQGGLVVVRSQTAISGDKLRDATKLIGDLETEKLEHEEKIQILESTKDSLSLKLEELNSIQQREKQLRQDIQLLDDEKNQAFTNLCQAETHIRALNETIESLNRDNGILSALLKSEEKAQNPNEVARFKIQVDNMQQMLDALAASKEMASQALQCEQSKVMTLNIEHDKYKYRAHHLEQENKALQLQLQQSKGLVDALKLQLDQNETLLKLKTKENDVVMGKLQQLIQQIGHMQYELQQLKDSDEALQLQLKQRDNQIFMLQQESVDMQKKNDGLDQLNEENSNLKRQLQKDHEEKAELEKLRQDKATMQIQIEQLQKKVASLNTAKLENDKLTSEFELLSAEHSALQNELYCSSMNGTVVQELKEQNASLQYCLAQLSKKETEINQNTASLEHLKIQLTVAEASNASLVRELQQIKELQPDWTVNCQSVKGPLALGDNSISAQPDLNVEEQRSTLARNTGAVEASGDSVQCTTTFRAPVIQPVYNLDQQSTSTAVSVVEAVDDITQFTTTQRAPKQDISFNKLFDSLQMEKARLEVYLQEAVTQEDNFRSRSTSVSNRLMAIDEEVAIARSELDMLAIQNQSDKDDLILINNRMATVQRQILRDDEIEGRLRDNVDELRLEKMSKRSHDLQCNISQNNSQIHDVEQNIQVLMQERASLEEEMQAKQWIEKKTTEDKCKILEKLVNLDHQLITMREILFLKTEENMKNKSCIDWPVQVGTDLKKNMLLDSQSHGTNSSDVQDASVQPSAPEALAEDAGVPEAQLLSLADNSNGGADVLKSGVSTDTEHSLSSVKAKCFRPTVCSHVPAEICSEPIEKAVADGVREGLKCGMITLKRQAAENLPTETSPDSINTNTESLEIVALKCDTVERLCQEKERVVQENLSGMLKDRVRRGLLEGLQDENPGNHAAAAVGNSGEEAELKLRLDLAAEEYRKLYTEKLKLEKRLAKVQQKQVASARSSSIRSDVEADNSSGNTGYICPICGVCFRTTESDLFTTHFEDHLS